MARSITATNTFQPESSGAFEVDSNLATMGGYACLAAGSALALGVGVAVVPAPVLGLATIGGGLVVAGNIEDVKAAFQGKSVPTISTAVAPGDATDGGKYATATEASAEAVSVTTQEALVA